MTSAEKKIGEDLAKLDLYAILGVSHDVTEKLLIKAYRKRALKCHPDKNPDNPAAVDLFHQLSKALEILSDPAARAAYDKIQKAKKASELRIYELGSKRRKLREDLDAREKASLNQQHMPSEGFNDISAAKRLEAEILRLRKEGSRLLKEEQQRLEQELKSGRVNDDDDSDGDPSPPRLKVKWKAQKGDTENGGYSKDTLMKIFHKYGDLNALLVSSKKNGSAVIEFETARAAKLAHDNEKGLQSNQLTLTWISGEPKNDNSETIDLTDDVAFETVRTQFNTDGSNGAKSSDTFTSNSVSGFSFNVDADEGTNGGNPGVTDSSVGQSSNAEPNGDMDFESLVLMRMRQAQERKRLAEEIVIGDGNDEQQS